MDARLAAFFRASGRVTCSAAFAGLIALGHAQTASAAPSNDSYEQVWDIEEYDHCIKYGYGEDVNCCIDSGGRWDGPNAGSGKCVAPDPPESESSAPGKGSVGTGGLKPTDVLAPTETKPPPGRCNPTIKKLGICPRS